jgi:hypothetical protein
MEIMNILAVIIAAVLLIGVTFYAWMQTGAFDLVQREIDIRRRAKGRTRRRV